MEEQGTLEHLSALTSPHSMWARCASAVVDMMSVQCEGRNQVTTINRWWESAAIQQI